MNRVFPILALCLLPSSLLAEDEFTQQQINFFEKKIRPVLVESCYECHSEEGETEGGLRVDLREGLLKGGETGPAIVPGNPAESLLVKSLLYKDGLEMPPDAPLSEDVIRDFRRWIKMGAPDPRSGSMGMSKEEDKNWDVVADQLWSLQPVHNPKVPKVQDASWPATEVDHFILAQLELANLKPVSTADPEQLIRRVTFDLIGLPPTPNDVQEFVSNPTPEAYAEYVDKLLATEQYGERWARHWFDIARFAESTGSSRDVLMPHAWRYRDYVIDAVNADIPYDRFLTEQLAGDLLPADSIGERDRLRVATGLLAIGSKSLNGGNLNLDVCDDQIDVIGKAVMGLTVSCARCHDHKFDPIPTADYYSLVGIFSSTDTFYGGGTNRPKDLGDKLKVYLPLGEAEGQTKEAIAHEKKLTEANKQRAAQQKKVVALAKKLPEGWQEKEKDFNQRKANPTDENTLTEKEQKLDKQLTEYRAAQKEHHRLIDAVEELKKVDVAEFEFYIGVRDAKNPSDVPIQIRGEKNQKGDIVPRGYLSCVSLASDQPKITNKQSGRLELARWLTDPSHPLTPRVMVNRVWMHLFGMGIVDTVANFGTTGAEPTHPELLDHLAHRFVHDLHWSRKALIRELVLSKTYQLSTEYNAENAAKDEANNLYWRRDRRRLEAEALRDAILTVSGDLNLERPYASVVTEMGEGEVGRGIPEEKVNEPYPYRSVYLPVIRGLVPEFLTLFDFPEPSNPAGTRMASNVPAQSLFLMNSPFVLEQSEKFAATLIKKSSDEAWIESAYLRCLSREPTDSEMESAKGYVAACRKAMQDETAAWAAFCQALIASAEFRYID